MTTRPIISIDVDDSSFKTFYEQFKQYDQKVQDLPESWKALNEAMSEAGGAFDHSVEGVTALKSQLAIAATSTAAIVEAVREAGKAQGDFAQATGEAAGKMKKLHGQVKNVASEIFGLGKWMLKMGSLGGIGGLIGGAATGFGLADLAGGALQAQKSASGLGLTVGQRQSWLLNMSPYAGANVLQGAAEGQQSLRKMGWFATLGINPQGELPTTIANQEINAARASYRQNPYFDANPAAIALSHLGWTQEDWRRVGTAGGRDLGGSERSGIMDAQALGYSHKVAMDMSRLSIAFDKAGLVIKSSLIEGLEPLTPLITKLAGEFAGLVTEYTPAFQNAMKELAGYLSSPAFTSGLKEFGDDVVTAGKKLEALIASLPGSKSTAANVAVDAAKGAAIGAAVGGVAGAVSGGVAGSVVPVVGNIAGAATGAAGGAAGGALLGGAIGAGYGYLSSLWNNTSLPPGLLPAIAGVESGGNPNAVSRKGAEGLFQLMPATAKHYGVNPFDPAQAARGATDYLHDLMWEFDGNLPQALAAYNWGPANLKRDIAKHGGNWRDFLPPETSSYLKKVMAAQKLQASLPHHDQMAIRSGAAKPHLVDQLGHTAPIPISHEHWVSPEVLKSLKRIAARVAKPPPVNLNVTNSTSARVAVSVNAAVN